MNRCQSFNIAYATGIEEQISHLSRCLLTINLNFIYYFVDFSSML